MQASFAGGEVSPRLYGRADLVKYASGAEAIENFIVRPEGGTQRRNGTRYAGTVKTESAVTRLVPFIFSRTQAYILEFGNLYIRFWRDYGQIISGTPVEVVTPYTTADLPNLAFAQSADTLYIVHSSYAPRQLTRTSDTSWTLATLNLQKGPFTTVNTDDTKHIFCTISGSNYDPGDSVTIQSNSAIFASGHVGSYMYLEERYYADIQVTPYGSDYTHNSQATVGDQYSNAGNVYACIATAGAGTNLNGQVPPTHTDGEAWDGPNSATNKAKWRYLHSRWGIISLDTFTDSKNMSGTIKTYLPNGLAPVARTITNVTNSGGICRVTSNGHGFSTGDYVNITGVTGATQANGDWRIINAATNTFDLEGSSAPSAYVSGGSAKRYSTYKWRFGAFSTARGFPAAITLHEQRLCYGNTTQEPFGVWMSRAGDYTNHLPGTAGDDAIAYLIAAPQVNAIRWLSSGDNLLIGTVGQEFAAFGGGFGDPITPTNVRVVPQSSEGSYTVQPEKAEGAALFVTASGRKVMSLDYETASNHYKATDISELASHLTEGGKQFTRLAWAKNPQSIMWALRSDGVLCALTYRRDQEVYAWHRHPLSDGVVESIAVIPSPDGTRDDLWMIVQRTVNGATRRYVEFLAPPYEPSSSTDRTNAIYLDSALEYSGAPATTLSGLSHLEGKAVRVLTNGALHPSRTVSGGAITLDYAVTQAWVGLTMTARIRTLRPEGAAIGTAMGKTKRVSRVTARVHNAIGGMCGPSDESVLETLVPRFAEDPMDAAPPLRSGDFDVNIASDYDTDGRVAIVQSDPLPLDLLSIMANVTVSEP